MLIDNTFFVSPEDFDAVGDGTTDDTTAVQTAIDASLEDGKILIFGHKQYAVSNIAIEHTGHVDFRGITLKKYSGSTGGSVVTVDTSDFKPSGSIQNLIIDMDYNAEVGLNVVNSWRHIFSEITVNHPPEDGIGIHIISSGLTGPGNIFTKINGYGNAQKPSTFIKLDATDNSFSDIDYQNYSIGLDCDGRLLGNNIHGYVTKDCYKDSVFIRARREVLATNLYPDTQHHMFEFITNNVPRLICNVQAYFSNEQEIDFEEHGRPVVFYSDTPYNTLRTTIKNFSIQGTMRVESPESPYVDFKYPTNMRLTIDGISGSAYYAGKIKPFDGSMSVNGSLFNNDVVIDMGYTAASFSATFKEAIDEPTTLATFNAAIIRPIKGKFPVYLSNGYTAYCVSDGSTVTLYPSKNIKAGISMEFVLPMISEYVS